MDDNLKKVRNHLESLCAKREYCSSDILKKAAARLDGDRKAAEELVAGLIGDGFVDDLRYASAFAREKASLTGWGPIKIRQALSIRGIPAATISEALSTVDSGKADEKLRRLIENKRRSLEGDPQIRLKLIRFALSRGFEYGQIEKLV